MEMRKEDGERDVLTEKKQIIVLVFLSVLVISAVGWSLTYLSSTNYSHSTFPLKSGSVYSDLKIADLNGDGLDDVILSGFSSLEAVYQNRTGGFENRTVIVKGYTSIRAGRSFVLSDLNMDGHVDIFTACAPRYHGDPEFVGNVVIAFNDGRGRFDHKEYHNFSEWVPNSGFWGLFRFRYNHTSAPRVGLLTDDSIFLLSIANSSLVQSEYYPLTEQPYYYDIIASDLYGDGRDQIIILDYEHNLTVFTPSTGQHLWTNVSQFIGPNESAWLVVADIDGDGVKDVGVASNLGRHRGVLVFFSVASRLNDPIFAKYYNSFTVSGATTGDLDEDGDEDVILSSVLEGSVLALMNHQTGELTEELVISGLIDPHSPALIHVRVGEQLRPAVIIISQIRDWYDLNEMQLIVIWKDES